MKTLLSRKVPVAALLIALSLAVQCDARGRRCRVRGRHRGMSAMMPYCGGCGGCCDGMMAAGLPPVDFAAAPMHMPPNPPPPPGTLGKTYQLPSRPVPAAKHPRVGMLDICVPGAEEVVVSDTNEFREEDYVDGFRDELDPNLWHFETRPLYPGLPHIYRVESRSGGQITAVRYVRLVRGRILEVTF